MKFVVPREGGILSKFGDRLKAELQTSQMRYFGDRLKAELQTSQTSRKPTERGHRRLMRAGLTGAVTLLARGITVGIGLITLPLTSHYLGKERFGLWLTLSSLITWMAIADLGLANSLINALSTADGKDDRQAARRAVASAFWLVTAIAAAAITICLSVAPLISWPRIFNVESPLAVAEITPAIVVVLLFCALRLPAAIFGCVYQAYQEGYVYQIWNGVSGLLAAAGLIVAIQMRAGLPWLAAAFLGSMLLADALSAIYLFGWRREWLLPSLRYFDWMQAKWLLRRGGQFWIAQASTVLLLQTDLVIVSLIFGVGETAGYGTSLRLFALIGAAQSAFIAPLWAAYGEASARGDTDWVSLTFKRSIRVSLLWSVPATTALVIAMPFLFTLLVTPDVKSNTHLRLAMMITEIINSITRCIAVLLNGLGAVRTLAIIGPVSGLVNIALSLLLGDSIGVPGVAWATAICLSLFWLGSAGRVALRQLEATNA
jgi:O-antigen/teichoic acid export membrane protein